MIKPDPWVQEYAILVPSGPVLDLACGQGRHGKHFLDLGYPVTFVDKDITPVKNLSAHSNAELMEYDLESYIRESNSLESCNLENNDQKTQNQERHDQEQNTPWPFHANQFSGIVVTNYLHRPLFPHLTTTIKLGGIIIYKTFSSGNEQFGRPKNPDFLLQSNELRTVFNHGFKELAFFQGLENNPKRITQAICVQRIS